MLSLIHRSLANSHRRFSSICNVKSCFSLSKNYSHVSSPNSSPIVDGSYHRNFCTIHRKTFASTSSSSSKLENEQFSFKKRSFDENELKTSFGSLVYRSPLRKNVYWCKLLSLSTSMTTFFLSPYVIYVSTNDPAITNPKLMIGVWSVFSSIFMFTPLLLEQLTKRFVLEMYYNEERRLYTAVIMNVLLQRRALQFRLEHVSAADPAKSLLCTHTVGDSNIPLLLYRQGYEDTDVRDRFESMYEQLLAEKLDRSAGTVGMNDSMMKNSKKKAIESDDEDDEKLDEPAKATTDHHKRRGDKISD